MTGGITGLIEAQAAIDKIDKGMQKMQGTRVYIGTRLPYGFGAEHGFHQKSGKLARREGGVFMLSGALDEALNGADILEGLNVVKAPGPWIVRRMALHVRRLARARAPRLTGRLKKSIRMFTVSGL